LIALLVVAPQPAAPPLVEAPPLVTPPPSRKLLPEARAELVAKRTSLLEQRPDMSAPLALTVISGAAVVAAVVILFVAFFSSWKNIPCTGFLCANTEFTPSQATAEWVTGSAFAVIGAVALPLSIRYFVRTKSADNQLTEQVTEIDDTLARGSY
jgi:hypothetical protein